MKKAWVLSYPLSAQRRLWSDWADAGRSLTLLVLSRGGSYNIAERSARGSEQCCINHYCSWTDSIKPSLVYPYDFLAFKGSHFQKTYLLFYIENFKILPLNYSSPYARVMDGWMKWWKIGHIIMSNYAKAGPTKSTIVLFQDWQNCKNMQKRKNTMSIHVVFLKKMYWFTPGKFVKYIRKRFISITRKTENQNQSL